MQVIGAAGALGPPAVLLVGMGSVPDRGSARDAGRTAVCVLLDEHFRSKIVFSGSVLVRLGRKILFPVSHHSYIPQSHTIYTPASPIPPSPIP